MKLPTFLFEVEDLAKLQAKLGTRLDIRDGWLRMTRSEELRLKELMEESSELDENAWKGEYAVDAVGRTVVLWEEAKSVADKAAVLALVLQLGSIREDIPRKLLRMLIKLRP